METGDRVLFTETQCFRQWWIYLIVLIVVVVGWSVFIQQIVLNVPFGDKPGPDWLVWLLWLIIGVGLPIFLLLIRLVTTVYQDRIVVHLFPIRTRIIKLVEIKSFSAMQYRPLAHYGGWGLRSRPGGGTAFTISGNQGVKFELLDGKEILIGSQKAEALESAVGRARNL